MHQFESAADGGGRQLECGASLNRFLARRREVRVPGCEWAGLASDFKKILQMWSCVVKMHRWSAFAKVRVVVEGNLSVPAQGH